MQLNFHWLFRAEKSEHNLLFLLKLILLEVSLNTHVVSLVHACFVSPVSFKETISFKMPLQNNHLCRIITSEELQGDYPSKFLANVTGLLFTLVLVICSESQVVKSHLLWKKKIRQIFRI